MKEFQIEAKLLKKFLLQCAKQSQLPSQHVDNEKVSIIFEENSFEEEITIETKHDENLEPIFGDYSIEEI